MDYSHVTLKRCLRMVEDLRREKLTVHEMSKRYEVTERSVYRYLRTFEDVGLHTDKDFEFRWFITN